MTKPKSSEELQERKRRVQNKINTQISLGICPVCNSRLIEIWNTQNTHKYQVCSFTDSHHKVIIDYVKDED